MLDDVHGTTCEGPFQRCVKNMCELKIHVRDSLNRGMARHFTSSDASRAYGARCWVTVRGSLRGAAPQPPSRYTRATETVSVEREEKRLPRSTLP